MIESPRSTQSLIRAKRCEAYQTFQDQIAQAASAILRDENVFRRFKGIVVAWEAWLRADKEAGRQMTEPSREAGH